MKKKSHITSEIIPQTAWDRLSLQGKAEMMKVAVRNGITNLQEIRQKYNEFKGGGKKPVTTGGAGYIPDNYGHGAVDEIRRRLYDNLIPFGYNNPVRRVYNAVVKNQKERYNPAYGVSENTAETLDALWAQYLQIPQESRHPINEGNGIVRSAGPDNKEYWQLKNPDPIIDEVVDRGLGYSERYKKTPEGAWNYLYYPPIKLGDTVPSRTQNQVLGDYQIGRGYDSRGEYLSYSDIWDINPYQKSTNLYGQRKPEEYTFTDRLLRHIVPETGDASMGIGSPVNIFGKIYLDDIYGVSEPTHTTYLPEVTVYGKKKSLGGELRGPLVEAALYGDGGEQTTAFTPIERPAIPIVEGDQEAVEWLANWYNNRREQMYNNLKDYDGKQTFLYNLKDWLTGNPVGRRAVNHDYYNKLNNMSRYKTATFDDLERDNTASFDMLSGNVLGITVPETGKIYYDDDLMEQASSLQSQQEGYSPLGVHIHERTHTSGMTGNDGKFTGYNVQTKALKDILRLKDGIEYNEYLDAMPEIYGRMMEFRYNHNLDPKKKYSKQEVKRLLDKESKGYKSELQRYNLDTLTKALNEVASTGQRNIFESLYV